MQTSAALNQQFTYDASGNHLTHGIPSDPLYLHTDHLMTPQLGTNTKQALVWKWRRDAFGSDAPSPDTAEVNLRFPGQYYDAESGLHYNWNRYSGEEGWTECVRKYLQRNDKQCDNTPNRCSDAGVDATCNARIHTECYSICLF